MKGAHESLELQPMVAATQSRGPPVQTKNSLGGAPTERRTMAVNALGLA